MTNHYSSLIRNIILDRSYHAKIGHIGSSLSIADIISTLFFDVMCESSTDSESDMFVLSKGHASLALYGALYIKGNITKEELENFTGDNTLLGVHPEYLVKGIPFSSGSLGQGITYACGAALAAKMRKSKRRVFALISDGECDEGSVWETALFAAEQQLSNLAVIIDENGQQALRYTDRIKEKAPLKERWQAFGWDVHEADGHNCSQMSSVFSGCDYVQGAPHIIIAHTIFGKGVSYMQNQIKWHYWPMSETEYLQAKSETQV